MNSFNITDAYLVGGIVSILVAIGFIYFLLLKQGRR